MKRTRSFYQQLNIALDLLAIKYPGVNSNYEALARLVNKEFTQEFNGDVTERDIWMAFEPDITTDELDYRLQHGLVLDQHFSEEYGEEN